MPSPIRTRVYPEFGTLEWPKSDKSDFGCGGGAVRCCRTRGWMRGSLRKKPPSPMIACGRIGAALPRKARKGGGHCWQQPGSSSTAALFQEQLTPNLLPLGRLVDPFDRIDHDMLVLVEQRLLGAA